MRKVDVAERRARLARRHCLLPGHRAPSAPAAADAMVALHATDPSTVYLSAWARVDGFTVGDLDAALHQERSLVRHLAMRRTLWVLTRSHLPLAHAAASQRVADAERRRLIKDVEAAGLRRDGARWLTQAGKEVRKLLADGRELTWSELREQLPLLDGAIEYGQGKKWGGKAPIGPRVLTVLSARGDLVRATNAGGWTASRPRWTSMEAWLGEPLPQLPEDEARADLVRAWLATFGPGTLTDISWWLGSTLTATRAALAAVGAVEVDLDGQVGYVLPDDLDPEPPVEPWAALLPPLDPTTMGWKERDWYVGEHRHLVFDTSGNGGPTAWLDGRIVGGWRQADSGEVVLQLLEDVGRDGRRLLEAEVERLSAWLGPTKILPRFPSPLFRAVGD